MLTTVRDAGDGTILWVPSSRIIVHKISKYTFHIMSGESGKAYDYDFKCPAFVITMKQIFVEAGELTEEQKLAFSILKGDPIALDMAKDILKL